MGREPFCGGLKKRLGYETRVGRQLVVDVGLKDGCVFDGRCVYEIEKPVRGEMRGVMMGDRGPREMGADRGQSPVGM